MLLILSIMLGLAIILTAIYYVFTYEYAGGIGARLKHNDLLSRSILHQTSTYSNMLESYLCQQFKLRNPPDSQDQRYNLMMVVFTVICLFLATINQSVGLIVFALVLFVLNICMPYINAQARQKKDDAQLDKEVTEMLEIFNFYLLSGTPLEETIHQTASNAGELLAPHMQKMVSSMMLDSKEEAITLFGKELFYNQNIVIFASALKQAIKGYEDTLSNFVSMQAKLHTQLKNEKIEEIIIKMPTKFNMVTGLLIISMIFFLVVPVFTNVFSGMDILFI